MNYFISLLINYNGDKTMLVKDLFPSCDDYRTIKGITSDSRFLKEGYIFIPLSGKNFSGEEFISEAINKKALVIVLDKYISNITYSIIYVNNNFQCLIDCLKKFYGCPFNDLCLIGITGTDGKTTTSTIINYLLSSKYESGYIGTNGIYLGNYYEDSLFTTPILSENYRLIKKASDLSLNYLTMEISSQGISNNRITDILFDIAVFTNLSHEHLDTHLTMEEYFKTKFKLFKQLKTKNIKIINKDDPYSIYFENLDNVIFFSIYTPSDYQVKSISYENGYTIFDLYTKNYIYRNLKINRMEEYNIYNVLPGIIISLLSGIKIETLYELLKNLPIVPGRLEQILSPYPYNIYIDFAHTPNALKAVLCSLKKRTKNRIIIVCGAAGGKDKSKRPLMGKVACEYADFVVFTSEDPRKEDPNQIIKQMVSELTSTNYICITERKKAIDEAFKIAKTGDSIIITGKGRENYFDIDGVIYTYSDYEYIKKKVAE